MGQGQAGGGGCEGDSWELSTLSSSRRFVAVSPRARRELSIDGHPTSSTMATPTNFYELYRGSSSVC